MKSKRAQAAVVVIAVVLALGCAGLIVQAHARPHDALWSNIELAACIGVILIPLAAILVAWRLDGPVRRPDPWAPKDLPPASNSGSRVFSYEHTYMRRLRNRMLWVSAPVALCLLWVMILPLRAWLRDPDNLLYRFVFGTMEPIALLIVLGISIGLRKGRQWYRELRLESGSDALTIVYPRLTGRVAKRRIPWSRVYWSGHMLLAGNVLVTLTDWQVGDHFEREPFESWVLSRVPTRNRLAHFAFVRRAIANRNPEFMLWAAALGGGLAWALVDRIVKA